LIGIYPKQKTSDIVNICGINEINTSTDI